MMIINFVFIFLIWYSAFTSLYFMFCLFIHSFINGNIRYLLLIGSGNIKVYKDLFSSDIQMRDKPVNIILLPSNRPQMRDKPVNILLLPSNTPHVVRV
jgi:hypothetical protein